MRLFSIALTVFAVLRLDPCGGGGGDGGGGGTNGGGTAGGGTAGGGTAGGGTTAQPGENGGVNVPDVFYEEWAFATITSYSPGEEPKISSASGKQVFTRDRKYTQDYTIGSFNNHYEGTYRVLGPDPRVAGAFKLETTDQDALTETWGVAVEAGGKTMAFTLYGDDGEPAIIMGLKLIEK